MDKKDEKRLRELIYEIDKIFSSENLKGSIEIIRDINKELREIVNRK